MVWLVALYSRIVLSSSVLYSQTTGEGSFGMPWKSLWKSKTCQEHDVEEPEDEDDSESDDDAKVVSLLSMWVLVEWVLRGVDWNETRIWQKSSSRKRTGQGINRIIVKPLCSRPLLMSSCHGDKKRSEKQIPTDDWSMNADDVIARMKLSRTTKKSAMTHDDDCTSTREIR